jgi:ketosteroid isomerase-like protein
MTDDTQLVRSLYRAYQQQDRDALERLIAPGFTFSSPLDDRIDRAAYFDRCYPNPDLDGFEFKRVADLGGEVVVTYELVRKNGTRARNTEILGVADGQVTSAEVYFGWDLATV